MTRPLHATGRFLGKGNLRSSARYGRSSLLRIVPPLCLASVFSASRVLRLRLSLCIERTGSKVPYLSLIRARAASRPGAIAGRKQGIAATDPKALVSPPF